jgi:hypothetical protein
VKYQTDYHHLALNSQFFNEIYALQTTMVGNISGSHFLRENINVL